MTTPNARRIAADLNTDEIEIAASGDRIELAGSTAAIDRLLDQVQPVRRPVDCAGQTQLFDPAPYTTVRQLPAVGDPQLALTSSTDRGAA